MRNHILTLFLSILCVTPTIGQDGFYQKLAKNALVLTEDKVVYDPGYFAIPYPNGDVPSDKGVCTDVVIRVYRKMDIDLQKEVHEDMRSNFDNYPKIWGLKRPDTNIDHRRVPNLMVLYSLGDLEKRCPLPGKGKITKREISYVGT